MSQYKDHSKFNCAMLPLLIGAIVFSFNPPIKNVIYFSLAFLYGTFFMNPDLDLAKNIKLLSLRGFFSIPFRSYSYIFKHRGISHSVLFGTITRVGWLFLFILGVLYIIYKKSVTQKDLMLFINTYKEILLFVFLGLFTADLGHLLLDKRLFKWKR